MIKIRTTWLRVLLGAVAAPVVVSGVVVASSYKPAETLPEGACVAHEVLPGESLSAIGIRYNLPWEQLAGFNSLVNPDIIYPGQTIFIPCGEGVPQASPDPAEFAIFTNFCDPGMPYDGLCSEGGPYTQTQGWFAFLASNGCNVRDGNQCYRTGNCTTQEEFEAGYAACHENRLGLTPGYDAVACASDNPGQVVFASTLPGNSEIFTIQADGSSADRLTNNDAVDEQPQWSPDGSRIAFISERDGNREVYVMDADGSNLKRLTDTNSDEQNPTWSPDGSRIAYAVGGINNSSFQLKVMQSDGSSQRTLGTDMPNAGWFTWAPSSRQLAYIGSSNGQSDVYIINDDGSVIGNLTNNPAEDRGVSWSQDGRFIAFLSRDGATNNISVVNVDGSDLRVVHSQPGDLFPPIWASDNSRLIFTNGGGGELFILDTATGQLTSMIVAGLNTQYSWSWADGGRIAFTSYRGGQGEPFLVGVNGTCLNRIYAAGYDLDWKQ